MSIVDSIGYFFLKILKADISKKLKFLFSNVSERRTARRLAIGIYGLIGPLLQFLIGGPSRSVRRPETWRKCCVWNIEIATDMRSPEFAADTPKAFASRQSRL